MKRSEINAIIRRFEELLKKNRFAIPPFLNLTPEEWKETGQEYNEIRDNLLGWDVTDYGMGNYRKMGLALITLRNGNCRNSKYPKTYAEKIIMLEEGQESPMHFHWNKMEDIINRGGGNIVFRLFNVSADEGLSDTDVKLSRDGRNYWISAGEDVILKPGESLTLQAGCYHGFVVEKGSKAVLIGEVSQCNDDQVDNRFLEKLGRFPKIEEDEAPYRLLCTDYLLG